MARNYTLAPIRPKPTSLQGSTPHGNWSAPTTMYSVELYCEPAMLSTKPGRVGVIANSTNGCSFNLGLNGNITMGENEAWPGRPVLNNREFTAMYVGYWNPLGFADYSLDKYCPITSNSTFYAAIGRNKARDTDPVQNVTAIYCWPTYYQQSVVAIVDAVTLKPSIVRPIGDKEPLASDLFNTSRLEQLMSSISLGEEVRGDLLPMKSVPTYYDSIGRTNLSLTSGSGGGGMVQPMVGLALAVSNLPLEEYLDWKVLAKSYADGYRLMFSRAMQDVLNQDFRTSQDVTGQITDITEAVFLEPIFVYIVEGFLGAISLATIILLYLSVTRTKSLRSNPSTIAAIMAMVADNKPLLADVEGLDCCTMKGIEEHLGHKRYKLVDDGASVRIVELGQSLEIIGDDNWPIPETRRHKTLTDIAKPVRPVEFSLWVAGPFIGVLIGLAVVLTVLFAKAHIQGLPLPSKNTIVQNIIENYIPTAVATLIEPIWVLINRLLCMLQPIEELQNCNARAKKSIDLDYASLPPQLVVFKAMRSNHLVLAAVCTMALLANLLAVSLAGLFNQITIDMQHTAAVTQPLQFKFVPVDGTIGPVGGRTFGSYDASGAYEGSNGEDQFLVADSYLRQGTPLPAWTDESMFYLPFVPKESNITKNNGLEAKTRAFGAKLECNSLKFDRSFQAGIIQPISTSDALFPSVNITVTSDTGRTVKCTKMAPYVRQGPISTASGSCVTGPSAAQFVFILEPIANATQADADVCMGSIVMGWLRNPTGSCGEIKPVTLNEQSSTFVHCRPNLTTGFATVRVDSSGRLQKKAQDVTFDNDQPEGIYSSNPVNIIGQSNRYIFKADSPGWHNDSFPDDFINYFVSHVSNSSRLVDPKQVRPTFEDIEAPLKKAYSLLFAIWMGINKDRLLLPSDAKSLQSLQGWRIEPEKRLFISTPMFAISETIFCIYAIVAIMVYMRRPGQYLARMPTSIASLVALFAASSAVLDMRGTSYLDKKGRAQHLKKVNAKYGYGSFVGGGDGRVHIGIEKTPFVRARSKTTWLEKKVESRRKGPGS